MSFTPQRPCARLLQGDCVYSEPSLFHQQLHVSLLNIQLFDTSVISTKFYHESVSLVKSEA